MYSTAPAPQIGEHTRTPLVSRDTGGGVQGTALIHSYIYRNKAKEVLLIAPYAIWLYPNAYSAFYSDSLSYLKIEIQWVTYKHKANLIKDLVCSIVALLLAMWQENKAFLNPWSPLCAGWLWLRSAHLSSLRQVLPGGPAALLHGGPRHRRCNLLEGEPGVAIMREAVTRRQRFERRRCKTERGKCLSLQTSRASAGMIGCL